ncbi:hypothetical protein Lal_00019153 [Lupinus albus]|nr:hypothetical protein Lal_00019153 [Lupinus albus]
MRSRNKKEEDNVDPYTVNDMQIDFNMLPPSFVVVGDTISSPLDAASVVFAMYKCRLHLIFLGSFKGVS